MSRIMWFDLETTGLDVNTVQVLEIGAELTTGFDEGLKTISTFGCPIYPMFGEHALLEMDPYVQTMHKSSGLWDECLADPEIDEHVGGQAWLEWMLYQGLGPETIVGGSGIDRYDCPIVQRIWPNVYQLMHWRRLDMSPVKMLLNAIGREDLVPANPLEHRALADAKSARDLARKVHLELGLDTFVMDGDPA